MAELAKKDHLNYILKSLRWKADMIIINPFGEKVWLKDCLDENGKVIGITDCCEAAFPCKRHKGGY